MSGSFTVLAHTADTAIEVSADSLAELFEWAAVGMFSLMYDLDSLAPAHQVDVVVAASDVAELLVDLLAELLYVSEANDLVPCTFHVEALTPVEARIRVGATPMEAAALEGPPIKAVTYHDLSVTELPDGRWSARVVFDV